MEPLAVRARLSEAQALALLQQHCRVLLCRLVFDALREHGAHATQKWMTLLCSNVTSAALDAGLGYELRAAIDIVNALFACWGFDPAHNGRFWRDAVAALWFEFPEHVDSGESDHDEIFEPPTNYMLPFGREAFSCFLVDLRVSPYELETSQLAELWRQGAWIDGSAKCRHAILESRGKALDQLRMCAERGLRTLKLKLLLPSNGEFPQSTQQRLPPPALWNWERVGDAVRACGSAIEHGRDDLPRTDSSTAHEISIAIQRDRNTDRVFALFTSNLRQVRELLTSRLQCLRLEAFFQEDRGVRSLKNEFVWLGELLHSLFMERQSLRTLRLEGHQRQHLVAAACSLLPMVTCLEALDVVGVDDGEDACWLSYALRHPLRVHELPQLAVSFDHNLNFKARLSVTAWTRDTPLRKVALYAVDAANARVGLPRMRADAFQWFAMATTQAHVLKRATALFVNPSWVQRAWKPVSRGTKLEVVVTVPSMAAVGVVVPGWGLCWIRNGAVRIETTTAATHRRGPHATKSLLLVGAPVKLPALLMDQVVDGASLVSLHLDCWGRSDGTKNDLEPLLIRCPNLECLILEGSRGLQHREHCTAGGSVRIQRSAMSHRVSDGRVRWSMLSSVEAPRTQTSIRYAGHARASRDSRPAPLEPISPQFPLQARHSNSLHARCESNAGSGVCPGIREEMGSRAAERLDTRAARSLPGPSGLRCDCLLRRAAQCRP